MRPGRFHCIECSRSYTIDTDVALKAVPDAGSSFTGWSGDCDSRGKVMMTADKACTASFKMHAAGDLNADA